MYLFEHSRIWSEQPISDLHWSLSMSQKMLLLKKHWYCLIKQLVEYTFRGRKNSDFQYLNEKIRKISLKLKLLVLVKICCSLFLSCYSQNKRTLRNWQKIRKLHFSSQNIWRKRLPQKITFKIHTNLFLKKPYLFIYFKTIN